MGILAGLGLIRKIYTKASLSIATGQELLKWVCSPPFPPLHPLSLSLESCSTPLPKSGSTSPYPSPLLCALPALSDPDIPDLRHSLALTTRPARKHGEEICIFVLHWIWQVINLNGKERIIALENLLESVADRMEMLVQKPSTRVQACQLLAKTKVVSWMVDILHPGSPRLGSLYWSSWKQRIIAQICMQ